MSPTAQLLLKVVIPEMLVLLFVQVGSLIGVGEWLIIGLDRALVLVVSLWHMRSKKLSLCLTSILLSEFIFEIDLQLQFIICLRNDDFTV
jgi:hypothetical protein